MALRAAAWSSPGWWQRLTLPDYSQTSPTGNLQSVTGGPTGVCSLGLMRILSVLSQKVTWSKTSESENTVSRKTLAGAFGISSGSSPSWAATGGSWGQAKGGDGSGLP